MCWGRTSHGLFMDQRRLILSSLKVMPEKLDKNDSEDIRVCPLFPLSWIYL